LSYYLSFSLATWFVISSFTAELSIQIGGRHTQGLSYSMSVMLKEQNVFILTFCRKCMCITSAWGIAAAFTRAHLSASLCLRASLVRCWFSHFGVRDTVSAPYPEKDVSSSTDPPQFSLLWGEYALHRTAINVSTTRADGGYEKPILGTKWSPSWRI
jgi:hypothetical protein